MNESVWIHNLNSIKNLVRMILKNKNVCNFVYFLTSVIDLETDCTWSLFLNMKLGQTLGLLEDLLSGKTVLKESFGCRCRQSQWLFDHPHWLWLLDLYEYSFSSYKALPFNFGTLQSLLNKHQLFLFFY